MISVRVYGTPAPQGSKRAFAHARTGKVVVMEMSKAVKPWRDAVSTATQASMGTDGWNLPAFRPVEGPLAVTIVFLMARPQMHYRKSGELKPSAPARPATRPDLDKLVRSTLDGLKAGGAYADDGQVADLCAAKVYASPGVEPGAKIEIEPCKEGTA